MELSNAIGNNFIITIDALPNFEQLVTDVTIPDLTNMALMIYTPAKDYPQHGDKLELDPITIGFNIDEGFWAYEEIFRWLRSQQNPAAMRLSKTLETDITITILSNNKNPVLKLTFVDAYPETLSGFAMSSTSTASEIIQTTATFRYVDLIIERSGPSNRTSPFEQKKPMPSI